MAKTGLENAIQQRWDEVAAWWAEHVQQDLNRAEVLLPRLLLLLGDLRGKRVLDAGCGEGILARALRARGADVIGVDFARVLDFARQEEQRRPLGITYAEANIARLHLLPEQSFDVIVCNLVLQGWPEIVGPLKEFRRLLVTGGTLLMTVHHPCYVPPGSAWFSTWEPFETLNHGPSNSGVYLVRIAAGDPAVFYFHRPLPDYRTALREAGFSFKEHILEATDATTPRGIKDRRLFLLIEATPC